LLFLQLLCTFHAMFMNVRMENASTTLVQTLFGSLAAHQRSRVPLAVFDCDGTVIQGDIGEAMLYHQLEHFLLRVSPAAVWTDHPHRDELHGLYEHLALQGAEKARLDQRFGSFAEQVLAWYFDQLAEGRTAKACADIVRLCAGFSPTELRQIAAETVTAELRAPLGAAAWGSYLLPRGIRFIEETVTLLNSLRAIGADI
jgi:phosphoserine phosphatase